MKKSKRGALTADKRTVQAVLAKLAGKGTVCRVCQRWYVVLTFTWHYDGAKCPECLGVAHFLGVDDWIQG